MRRSMPLMSPQPWSQRIPNQAQICAAIGRLGGLLHAFGALTTHHMVTNQLTMRK